jgi:hypothetical protein
VPGLRDLYCYWIGLYLGQIGQIDVNAAAWVVNARKYYEQMYGSAPAGRNWLKQAFGKGGLVTKEEMQLTMRAQVLVQARNVQPSSKYGVWGSNPAGPW